MNDKEKRPSSGFVAGFGGECGLQLDLPNICRTISMEPVEELGECIVIEYADRDHRPSDIAQIRRLLAGKSKSFAVVNAVLVALIALLLVVIGVMTNARQDTRTETVAADSVAADGVNRVVDSNLW